MRGAALCVVCGRELPDEHVPTLCSAACARGLAQDVLQARPAAMMLAHLAQRRGPFPDAQALHDARGALLAAIDRVEQAKLEGAIATTPEAQHEWSAYAERLQKVACFLERLALSE